jgi:hypothetical protein
MYFISSSGIFSFSIAIRYRLDGTGIESRWKENFQHPSRPSLGLKLPTVLLVSFIFLGVNHQGTRLWSPTTIYSRGQRKNWPTPLLPIWTLMIGYRMTFALPPTLHQLSNFRPGLLNTHSVDPVIHGRRSKANSPKLLHHEGDYIHAVFKTQTVMFHSTLPGGHHIKHNSLATVLWDNFV